MNRSLLLLGISTIGLAFSVDAQPTKKNVLFIVIDDLRPQLGCYGDILIKSPNIDRLASQGTLYERAYCPMALSGPSRMSILSGYRPTTTNIFNITTHLRETMPDVVTLPQHFMNNGYQSIGLSKIFHQMGGMDIGNLNDSLSWSVPHWNPKHRPYNGPRGRKVEYHKNDSLNKLGIDTTHWMTSARGVFYESVDTADSMLQDGATTVEAINRLRKYKNEPFFLAVGFIKPHLPLVAPKRYYDMYDLDDIPLAPNPFTPIGAPAWAIKEANDWRWYDDSPKKGAPTLAQSREWVRAYMACISFADAQVGLLLDELEQLGLSQNTVVVLVGDNGFQMGEHSLWGNKHTNYETSARVPFIISDPSIGRGVRISSPVEILDIYNTLTQLCGVEPVANQSRSLVSVMAQKDSSNRKGALSVYNKKIPNLGNCIGFSLRTKRYRFIEWAMPKDNFVEYELYDHQTDPQENYNLANLPQYKEVIESHKQLLETIKKE